MARLSLSRAPARSPPLSASHGHRVRRFSSVRGRTFDHFDGGRPGGYQNLRMTAAQNFWKSRRAVGFWLLAVALVILAMVTIGGLTRLTGSGPFIHPMGSLLGA